MKRRNTNGPGNPSYQDKFKRYDPWDKRMKKACDVVESESQARRLLEEGETLVWLADGITLRARSSSAKQKKVRRS